MGYKLMQLCISQVAKISGSIFWDFPVHSFPYKGGVSSSRGDLGRSLQGKLYFFIFTLSSIRIIWVPAFGPLSSSIYSWSLKIQLSTYSFSFWKRRQILNFYSVLLECFPMIFYRWSIAPKSCLVFLSLEFTHFFIHLSVLSVLLWNFLST